MIDWYDIDLGDGASFTLTSQLSSAVSEALNSAQPKLSLS